MLIGRVSQVSDEFVQLCFEQGEFVLSSSHLLFGLDFFGLQLLSFVRPVLEFCLQVLEQISEFVLLRQVLFGAQ